jgi:hypothetical protein
LNAADCSAFATFMLSSHSFIFVRYRNIAHRASSPYSRVKMYKVNKKEIVRDTDRERVIEILRERVEGGDRIEKRVRKR